MSQEFTEADRKRLRGVVMDAHRRVQNTQRRPAVPDASEITAPEVYVALTPVSGIPPLDLEGLGTGSGNDPGGAICDIYRLLITDAGTGSLASDVDLLPVSGLKRTVYNLSDALVAGDSWILAVRDKFGTWWAVPTATVGSGSLEVKTTNPGTGDSSVDVNSVSILQIDQGSGLKEVNNGGGNVTVSAQNASTTHAGVVNLSAQTLGDGNKAFQKQVIALNGASEGFWSTLGSNPAALTDWTQLTASSGVTAGTDTVIPAAYWASFSSASTNETVVTLDPENAFMILEGYHSGAPFSYAAAAYAVVDGSGLTNHGIYTTALAGDGATLTFSGGLLTGKSGSISSSIAYTNVAQTFTAVQGVTAGTGSGVGHVGGCLFDHYADTGNSTTTETDLYSDTVPANTLVNNGDKLESEYGGVFVSSATATRQVKLYFGGTAIFDTGALTLSLSSAWTLYATVVRKTSTVIRYMVSFTTEGAALSAYTAVGELTGLTLSNTNVLKVTGQAAGVGAASGDITAKLGSVSWVPAA